MQLGYSRRKFAEICSFSAATLQAWEDGKYLVPEKSIIKYVKALSMVGLAASSEWFLEGVGISPRPINKAIDAPNITIPNNAPSEEEIIIREISFFEKINENPIIVTIPDKAMLPFFDVGDYVAGNNIAGKHAQKYVGSLCIVTMPSGKTLVRKLKLGSKDGFFHLVSTNLETNVETAFILNCNIQKIAPIIWHRKLEQKRIN